MKKKHYLLLAVSFLCATVVFGQVDFDDCADAIVLGEGPSCPETIFSNIGATPSTIYSAPDFEIPSCWSDVGNDVWAVFTVPADGSYTDFQITLNGVPGGPNGSPMFQPRLAIYRGECLTDGLVELACEQANVGSGTVQFDIEGLTPGSEYFLRMSTYSASATPNDGDFMVCVDTIPISTIEAFAEPATLCSAQGFTQLSAVSTGSDLSFYSWEPTGLLSSPNSATTFAFPFQTTTFTVTAFGLGANLVQNGDFESGNLGFTSEYNNVDGNLSGLCQGCYNINNSTPTLWTQCPPIDGNMMVVNGSPEANVNLWCQQISVIPQTDYFFSFDVQTINTPVPQLQLSVDGNLIGGSLFGGGACNVLQFYETVTVGGNSTIEICIVNQSTSANGNDFALDNINFSTYVESTDSVTVEVSNLFTQVLNVMPDGCQAGCTGSAEVSASGGIGSYTYEWSGGQNTAVANDLCAGSQMVTVTDEAGCSVVQQVNIGQTQFEISVVSLVSPCEASTIGSAQVSIFGGTEPYVISWDNGATTAVAEDLTAGVHQVTVTDAGGCEAVGEVEIIISPEGFMVEIVASKDTICPGETAQLTAVSGGTDEYEWNTGAVGGVINVTPGGTSYYQVSAKRLGNNILENGDFTIGNTGFISDYNDAIGLGLGGAWGPLSLEGTYAITNNPALVHTNFIACGDHTTGTGNMMVVNGSGVSNLPVWCQTVAVDPNLTYQFSAWLTSVVADNPAVLQFSINGNLLGSPFNAQSTPCQWTNFFEIWESAGATTAEICIVNQNIGVAGNDFALDDIALVPVCLATAGITIQVDDLGATIAEVQDVSCLTNFGSASAIAVNGQAPFTYNWSNGESMATVSDFEAGTYTVTITDNWGCSDEASVTINPAGEVSVDEILLTDVSCGPLVDDVVTILPGSAEVTVGAGDPPFSYSIDGGTTFQENPLFENLDAGTYNLVIMDANQCPYDTSFAIQNVELPTVTITTAGDFNLCEGGSIDLALETTGTVENILWSTNATDDQITITETGMISVIVSDDQGCSAFAVVDIDDCTDYRIPNVFTPNNDGYNDEFKVYTSGGVQVKQMKIFNRWGTLVHDSTEPWDGYYKGEPHQADVLIYIILIETSKGEITEEGEVTLLR